MVELKGKWLYTIGSLLVLLIGFSRVYLGVHRPVDVLAGIILGSIWVFAVNRMFDISERTGKKGVFLLFIIPMVFLLPFMPNQDYYKASGIALALYTGYVIEPRYIKFQVKAGLLTQVLKMVIGVTVMVSIKEVFKIVLPNALISGFFRFFLIGMWVAIGAPYIFKIFFCIKEAALTQLLQSYEIKVPMGNYSLGHFDFAK